MPDISYFEDLCTIPEIKVNELISGEFIEEEDYSEKAESNLIELIKESNIPTKKIVFNIFSIFFFLPGIIVLITKLSGYGLGRSLTLYLDAPTFLILIFVNIICLVISDKRKLPDILNLLKEISLPVGFLLFLIQLVLLPSIVKDYSILLPCIGVCLLTPLYSFIEYLIVLITRQALYK